MKPSRLTTDAEIQFAKRELKRCKDVINEGSSDRSAYDGLVTYAIQLGLYHEAIQVLERAVKEFPKESFFYIGLGDVYYSAGYDSSAITAYEMVMRISSQETSFYERLVELYLKNKKYKDVVGRFGHRKDIVESLYLKAIKDSGDQEDIFKAFCSSLEESPGNEHVYTCVLKLVTDNSNRFVLACNTFCWVINHNIECRQAFKALYDLAIQSGKYQEALEAFFKNLKALPSHEDAYYYLKGLLEHTQDHKQMVSMFSQLIIIAPQVKHFYTALAKAYSGLEQSNEAIDILKKALKYCGDDDEIFFFMTEIYMQQGKMDYALKFIERIQKVLKKPQTIMRLQYQIYLKMNRKQVALDFYKQVMQRYPNEKKHYNAVYELCCEMGDYLTGADLVKDDQETIASFVALIAKNESFPDILEVYEKLLFRFPNKESLYREAIQKAVKEEYSQEAMFWMYRLLDQKETDAECLQEAYDLALQLKRDQDSLYLYSKARYFDLTLYGPIEQVCLRLHAYCKAAEVSGGSVEDYHRIYQLAIENDKVYDGIDILEQALQKHPHDATTMTYLIKYYQDLDNYHKARDLCERLSPHFNTSEQYYEWALLEKKLEHYNRSVDVLEKGIQKYSEDISLALLLGDILVNQGEPSKAIQTCLHMRQHFPDEVKFLLFLGQAYEKEGSLEQSFKMYSKAISLDTSQLDIYRKLVLMGKKMGKQEWVVDVCQKAITYFADEMSFYLDLGDIYRQKKDFSKAIEVYRDALKLSPGDKLCYQSLFYLYCDTKDFGNALRICPEERQEFLNLYQLCYQSDQHEMVVEILKKAVRFFPSDFELYQKLAKAFYRMKQLANAEEIFLKMLKIDPEHRQSYVNLFALRCQMEHFEDAIDVYVKAYRRWPTQEEFVLNMAAIHYKLKHYEQAVDNYKRAIKINDARKSTFQKLGFLYEKLKRWQDASLLYKEAIIRFPHDIEFCCKRAYLLENMENYTEAARILRQAIQNNSMYIPLYTQLGNVYKKTGRYKECVQCYEDAIRLDDKNEQRYVDLGNIYIHFEREIEALDLFKVIVRRWSHNTMAYKCLFGIYHSQKKYDYAEEYYKELIALDQEGLDEVNPLPYLYLFNIYYVQKKFMDAIQLLENCLTCLPKNTDLIKRLAGLYYQLGKPSEAIVYFQKCLDINPEDKTVYKYLFNIFFKAKRFFEAMQFYKKAIILWPDIQKEFAMLYKLCNKIEMDEEAFKQITAILEDFHNEKQWTIL